MEASTRRFCMFLSISYVLAVIAGCGITTQPATIYDEPAPRPGDAALLLKAPVPSPDWSDEQLLILRNLWIGSLPPIPVDPSNAVAGDARAAALGHRLFFEPRLSANNQIACATCHIPERAFTDGEPVAHGTRPNQRNTMSIVGSAYAPWLLWDGHKDSLWAQAIEPIEAIDEHGATRLHAVHLIANDEAYRKAYEQLFGPLPPLEDYARFPDSGGPVDFLDYRDRWEGMTTDDQMAVTQVFVNMGKAIAAYERLLIPDESRFDVYVRALLQGNTAGAAILTADEIGGLRLFIGEAGCIRCHDGPLFSDFSFHNTGVPPDPNLPSDDGRAGGLAEAQLDEFNCASIHVDATDDACTNKFNVEKDAAENGELTAAFRTGMLRNVTLTAPYMHAGQHRTLAETLDHYNRAPQASLGSSELTSLNLDDVQLKQLEAFLHTLEAAPNVAVELLSPPNEQ